MHFIAVKYRSHPSSSLLLKLPNFACYSAHAMRSVVGTLYMYNNKKKLWGSQNCFRKEHIASVLKRLPPRKKFLAGNYFISCFHDPDSVSEVSAECEFPSHLSFWKALLEKFRYNDIKAAFTLKTTLRVLKLSLVLLPIHPSIHPCFFEQETWICKLLCFNSALKFRKQLRLWFDIVCCKHAITGT